MAKYIISTLTSHRAHVHRVCVLDGRCKPTSSLVARVAVGAGGLDHHIPRNVPQQCFHAVFSPPTRVVYLHSRILRRGHTVEAHLV